MTFRKLLEQVTDEMITNKETAKKLMESLAAHKTIANNLHKNVPPDFEQEVRQHYRQLFKSAIQLRQIAKHIKNFKNN